jgi:1-acyl-sn-glycerol-3-phosphate acyltransferase
MAMVALVFYLMYPLFYFYTRKPQRYPVVGFLRGVWVDISFWISGIFYRVDYEQPLDSKTTYIYCSNHSSYLDTPFMCAIAKGNFHFMGKKELLKNPVLKLFFQTIDIPVDRESKIGSFRALKKAEENLASGRSLILFPEGTMSLNPPELGEFKNGAFKLAVDKQVAIVPVTFMNNYKIMRNTGKKHGSRPGVMRAYVHAPIETKGMGEQDIDGLRDKVFELINQKVHEYAD